MIADMVKKGLARPELTLTGNDLAEKRRRNHVAARPARCRMADTAQDRIDNVIQLQARKPPRTNRAECDANRLCLQREFAK